jgi:protein involved in polysaccharide export with SLBB domain
MRFFLFTVFAIGTFASSAWAQGASTFDNITPGNVPAITVEKPAAPEVRRAQPVNRPVNPPPAPQTAAPAPHQGSAAVFRPGDTFELRMSGMPQEHAIPFALSFTIGGDGFVNIPLGGQVRAAGLSQSQLERAIESRLIEQKMFRWPVATINVATQARFVTVGGNVRAPNRAFWSSDMTLLSALSAAGGPGDFASDKVNLIRGGQVTTYSIKRLKRNPADDPALLPGDQVDLL